jgi:hypothetical protein
VGRARVDEEGVTQLPNVSQPLERGCIDDPERDRIDPDRIPDGIANDFEVVVAGPGRRSHFEMYGHGFERRPRVE